MDQFLLQSKENVMNNSDSNVIGEEGLVASKSSGYESELAQVKAENARLLKLVERLKKENSQLKKRKAADVFGKSSSSGSSGNSGSKKLKTPAQVKKVLEKWQKALVRLSKKSKVTNSWGGGDYYSVEVKETTPWSKADFESLFNENELGKKIQPLPDNKPTSTITIIRYTFKDLEKLFERVQFEQVGYECQLWRSRNFQKSYKCGMAQSMVTGMDVHWNKSKQSLTLKFDMRTGVDGGY